MDVLHHALRAEIERTTGETGTTRETGVLMKETRKAEDTEQGRTITLRASVEVITQEQGAVVSISREIASVNKGLWRKSRDVQVLNTPSTNDYPLRMNKTGLLPPLHLGVSKRTCIRIEEINSHKTGMEAVLTS